MFRVGVSFQCPRRRRCCCGVHLCVHQPPAEALCPLTSSTSRLKLSLRRPLCKFQSSNVQPSACGIRQNGRFSSTSTTTTYQHHYHELKPHHFACELPGIGEVDQCWFPHEHLSIRVCGLEACAAMSSSKQVIQRSTCFRRFDILSPADSGGYAASEGDDGDGGAGAVSTSSFSSSSCTSLVSWPPPPLPSAGGRQGTAKI